MSVRVTYHHLLGKVGWEAPGYYVNRAVNLNRRIPVQWIQSLNLNLIEDIDGVGSTRLLALFIACSIGLSLCR